MNSDTRLWWHVSAKLPNGWYTDQIAKSPKVALQLLKERFPTVELMEIKFQKLIPYQSNIMIINLEPGEPVCNVNCPCCGSKLSVEVGDDEGFSVIGESVS